MKDQQAATSIGRGALILNADDWGRDAATTDRIFDCARAGALSSVSAMVFMQDSERSAAIAREHHIDAGLHLNLTLPFSGPDVPGRLVDEQARVADFLQRRRFSQVIFHPGLKRSFQYVVEAQIGEFARLFGQSPRRVDGHHHMHLCANVLLGNLLPAGTIARRNFSFSAGEKSLGNRFYRRFRDRVLARRHILADYFYSLPPLTPEHRLRRIFALAQHCAVEVETHPIRPDEYRFLAGGEIFQKFAGLIIAPNYALRPIAAGQASSLARHA
ncbi:MAG TPA: ChbG/HpnK family deacetylase [Terriglobales bacterium]|nr:ChbG/HpnK family deacetylase [Terriglobales bacterium]